MSLYQEMPKDSILTVLRSHYSPEELDSVRLELDSLLHRCCTLDQLHSKLFELLQTKRQSRHYAQNNEGNLINM